MIAPPRLMTADDLARLPNDGQGYELVQGELRTMAPPGGEHGDLASHLNWLLRGYAWPRKLGRVLVETGYKLAASPDTVRSPDVSFIREDRLGPDGIPPGFINGPPDLAVEIVSPHDTMNDVMEKVREYLHYGVRLVWVVVRKTRSITVYRPDGSARVLYAASDDILDGEDVIPGFSISVAEIFAL